MLAVAVASSRTLEALDLEGTGLTNQSAQVTWTIITLIVQQGEPVPLRLILDQFLNCSDVSCAGFPGHGGELPDQSAPSGSG